MMKLFRVLCLFVVSMIADLFLYLLKKAKKILIFPGG